MKERNSFKNLGQYKAYLRAIDNFDQLYIIQQFESYLQEVDEIKDLAYMINSNKANINDVKQAFRELFKRNSDEILKFMNPKLKESLNLTNKKKNVIKFKELIDDTNSELYNFIKSQ